MPTSFRVNFLLLTVLLTILLSAGAAIALSPSKGVQGSRGSVAALTVSAPTGNIPRPPVGSGSLAEAAPTGNIPRPPVGSGSLAQAAPTGNIPRPPVGSGSLAEAAPTGNIPRPPVGSGSLAGGFHKAASSAANGPSRTARLGSFVR
jgi:hypothetical protein